MPTTECITINGVRLPGIGPAKNRVTFSEGSLSKQNEGPTGQETGQLPIVTIIHINHNDHFSGSLSGERLKQSQQWWSAVHVFSQALSQIHNSM